MDTEAWPDHPDNNRELPELMTATLMRLPGKVFTGVYMIRPESDRRVDWFWWPKVRYISEIVLGRLWRDRFFINDEGLFQGNLWEAHSTLISYRGWGPFMAIQAVVDMMYCPLVLGEALDRNQWMVAGPGTMRGLNRIYGRDINKRINQHQAQKELHELWGVFDQVVRMDLPDVANVCCEVDKYQRIKLGQGRMRNRYYACDTSTERPRSLIRRPTLST
jgi:hypothetical protein